MASRTISRLVVELRRSKKWFEFVDDKGRLIDGAARMGFEQIQFNEASFIVADNTLTRKLFVSTDNMGVQAEKVVGVSEADELLQTFYRYLADKKLSASFGLTNFRVGTKVDVLFSPKRQDFNKVKRIFREKLMKGYAGVEDVFGVRTSDYFEALTASYEDGRVNLQIGPVTADEAVNKFFNNDRSYISGFDREAGYFASIDFFREDVKIEDHDKAQSVIDENLSRLEELVSSFESALVDAD